MEIYSCRTPGGLRVPILTTPTVVDDGIPSEEDIEQAVRELKRGVSGGPSDIRANDLKGWMLEAM